MKEAHINGKAITPQAGETILEAAQRLGVTIPTICHADGLRPEGGCRICLVECEGEDRPLAACHCAIQPGMNIHTDSEEIETLRAQLHELYDHQREITPIHSLDGQET
ncbi:MAG: 2Fe-2S iron-sulfur cluster-binding protein, partial [Akkermansiaceae bacterium]